MAYLDNNGVLYFWGKIKAWVQGQGYITSADVPEGAAASTTTPKMDGTAAVGSETAFARGDHVHPHDSTKVDKVTGKGLSTNDYTTAEKEKLAGIEAGAQVNPTNISAFTNDVGYITQHQDISGKVDKVSGKGLSTNDYTTAEKNKLAAFGSASDYALKSDITNMYKYKGSVATVSALPSSGNTTGDVYNVEASGMNYAWNGSDWDALGETFTITAITNTEIDSICT